MSEKDIKTKPKQSPKSKGSANMPKVAVKSKDAVVNTVKDAKAVMKDTLVKKAVESKLGTEQGYSEPQKADTEASERVENAAYTTADTVYHKGKTFTQNKIKEHRQKVKTRENEAPENQEPTPEEPETPDKEPKTVDNEPKTKENYNTNEQPLENQKATEQAKSKAQEKATVKTKEEYLKSQSETSSNGVKTKENYIKQHTPEDATKGVKGKEPLKAPSSAFDSAITPKDARKEYVSKKLKTKAEYQKRQAEEGGSEAGKKDTQTKATELNAPKEKSADVKANTADKSSGKSMVKTKESYMQSLRDTKPEPIKSPYNNTPKSKQSATSVKRSTANSKKALKTRDNVVGKSRSVVKKGSAYTTKTAKKKTAKATKKVVKTQKEVTKKAAKEAAKRARQAAIKAAKVAKAVAIKTAKAVAAIGKAIASAVAKAAAAFFAAFGWIGVIVVLVILIVIIIVAAIAGSPFGIFISDEAADADSIPVSSIVNECNMELSARLTEIEDNTTHNRIVMEGEQADWSLVLSLFSVKVAGVDDETVQDVVVIDDAKKQKLKDVFWDMHTITSRTETVTSGETSETVLYITITAKTKDEMISQYHFTNKQKEALETLLENADGFIGTTQSLAISDATAQDVIDNLPDSLSAERKNVVKKACSLVGKLTYFWGGKSSAIGWDSEWGKMKLVTAEGSRSSGCMRPYGLDCSGFVTWSFINAGFSASAIGHGTSTQVSKGTRISLSSAQPGDLAFYNDYSSKANPDIFNETYTRDAYNAIRQSIVDIVEIIANTDENGYNADYEYAHFVDESSNIIEAMKSVTATMFGYYNFSFGYEPTISNLYEYPGYRICKVQIHKHFESANNATDSLIAEIKNLSNREKAKRIADYICDRVVYKDDNVAGINSVFTETPPVNGLCGTYANAFVYLCQRADIPCISVKDDAHAWNEVYVDGEWYIADISYYDVSRNDEILFQETYVRTDIDLQKTNFAKELLVPGSTK